LLKDIIALKSLIWIDADYSLRERKEIRHLDEKHSSPHRNAKIYKEKNIVNVFEILTLLF
jgi:hypothetical protein